MNVREQHERVRGCVVEMGNRGRLRSNALWVGIPTAQIFRVGVQI